MEDPVHVIRVPYSRLTRAYKYLAPSHGTVVPGTSRLGYCISLLTTSRYAVFTTLIARPTRMSFHSRDYHLFCRHPVADKPSPTTNTFSTPPSTICDKAWIVYRR